MRVLCCSAQLPGHLDWGGYLPTAGELVRRGHAVLWASEAAVREPVVAAGVPFAEVTTSGWRWPPPPPLPPPANPADPGWQQERALRALDQWLDVERVAAAVAALLPVAQAHRPDVVVTETFIAAAGCVAEMVDVPLIVAGWPARRLNGAGEAGAADPLVQAARGRLDELRRRFGLTGQWWTQAGPPALLSSRLHVTYWSPTWYGGVPLLPQTQHFGGVAAPGQPAEPALPDPEQQPWVLITLGTSFSDDPNFFLNAAHAADRLGCLPILAVGSPPCGRRAQGTAPAWQQRLPHSAVLRELVAFDAVLPYTAVAIHHGGAGTTHALVTHAIPQLVVPHAADQMHQAQGVVRSGVGIHLPPKQASVDALTAALATLLPDLSEHRRRAQQLRAEFAALGGIPAAADAIERNIA